MENHGINDFVASYEEQQARRISGFWRRIAAFLLDSLLLALIGFALGAFCFDFLADLGALGKLLGFSIALAYFGLLNSSIGRGQTLGKRMMKIEVVDRSGRHIALGRSLLRYMVLGAPYFLNNTALPANLLNAPGSMLISFIIFGCGSAIIYMYLFNRRTRQSLHDLVAGTFVVRTEPTGAVTNTLWRPHLTVVGILFALALMAPVYLQRQFEGVGELPQAAATQHALLESGMVQAASVHFGKSWTVSNGNRSESTFLKVQAMVRLPAQNDEATSLKIGRIVFDTYDSVLQKDLVSVIVTRGYDIGIARASVSYTQTYSPDTWLEMLEESTE